MSVEETIDRARAIREQLGRVVVGQPEALDQTVIALLAGGHVLLEGPPGTAKTLLARALSLVVTGTFVRIQFTPDLMPADIVGVNVYQAERARFEFQPGPLFGDIVLADEVNRAPAKTQSALLEAMQERQASVDGHAHRLSPIFTVVATQNPIEYEGTYPLPEAQLDRFLIKALVEYPSEQAELDMLRRHRDGFDPNDVETFAVEAVVSPEALLGMRKSVQSVRVSDDVLNYVSAIVRATRHAAHLTLGASPRAGVMLLAAGRAMAVLRGRTFATPDDVRDVSRPVLRHRLVLTPEAEIEGISADQCVGHVLERVPVPRIDPS